MRFIKLLIIVYKSKSSLVYHQLLFAPIPVTLTPNPSPRERGSASEEAVRACRPCRFAPSNRVTFRSISPRLPTAHLPSGPRIAAIIRDYSPISDLAILAILLIFALINRNLTEQ